MFPIILLLFMAYLALIYKNIPIKYNLKIGKYNIDIVFFLICIVYIIIISFRDINIGFDTIRYYEKFYDHSFETYIEFGEVGSYLLMEIAYYFNYPHLFFLFVAVIFISLVFSTIKKYSISSDGFGWSLLLFLGITIGLESTLSIQRQVLSAAVIVFSTKYLIERKIKPFLTCIFFASMFHISAIVYCILYPLTKSNIKYKYYFLICALLVLLFNFSMNTIVSYFPQYEFYLSLYMDDGHGIKQLLLYVIFYVLFLLFYIVRKTDNHYRVFFKIYTLGVAILIGLYPIFGVSIAARAAYVPLLYILFLFPYCLLIKYLYLRTVIKLLMLVSLTGLAYYTAVLTELIPYTLIIQL